MDNKQLWERFKKYYYHHETLGISIDISRMKFPDDFFETMAPKIEAAFDAMQELEAGAIANPDENRMVGHYWLRSPERAPSDEISQTIHETTRAVKRFAEDVHAGRITGPNGLLFMNVLLIGIGGSALGPQLAADALGGRDDHLRFFSLDNTDPDGIDRVMSRLSGQLDRTLCIVISKSGGTPETRNGMLEVKAAYERSLLNFSKHAVAVTSTGSKLYELATEEEWIETFPMWDWVGGRTSQTSAVGLLPAALQGLDIDGLLSGARAMDELTRNREAQKNPAALLALMWYYAGDGKGCKDMVILPYRDRLMLFSKYLQQLVMESLGKELDLEGNVVEQGLAVYGNKGSTDQHAYVQQLREGLNNFFATFIQIREEKRGKMLMEVEPGITSGDYLAGFMLGTRQALYEKGRESILISLKRLDARALGMMIALYERAVGFYATMVNINAYHQPGVEAGKKAAGGILDLQKKLVETLKANKGNRTADGWAELMGEEDQAEVIYKTLERLSSNPARRITREADLNPFHSAYGYLREE